MVAKSICENLSPIFVDTILTNLFACDLRSFKTYGCDASKAFDYAKGPLLCEAVVFVEIFSIPNFHKGNANRIGLLCISFV